MNASTTKIKISHGDTGAMGELIIAADLIKQGWDVFRNLSPNGPVDLIAFRDGDIRCVQVKTCPTKAIPSLRAKMGDYCDALAVVLPSGNIEYYPHPSIVPDFCPETGTIDYIVLKNKPLGDLSGPLGCVPSGDAPTPAN